MLKFNVYEYTSPQDILVKILEIGGHGQISKLARFLSVHPSMISQFLKKHRSLSLELAFKICNYFDMSFQERDYFLTLIELDRAGSADLKNYFADKVKHLQDNSKKIKVQAQRKTELSEADKLQFYSQWYYSAIRILSSIPAYQNLYEIKEKLALPEEIFDHVIEFLSSSGLVYVSKDRNSIEMGTQSTQVPEESPMAERHHQNWRQKALALSRNLETDEFRFTGVVSLSQKDAKEFRQTLLNLIRNFAKKIDDSPPEKMCCLTIDWLNLFT